MEAPELQQLMSTVSDYLGLAKEHYAWWNLEGNDDTDELRLLDVQSLGERVDGLLGRREAPAGYIGDVISLTLWCLSLEAPPLKCFQICAGRWIRNMGFRRATCMVLGDTWQWMIKRLARAPAPRQVCDELLMACCLAPLYFASMRHSISGEVSISDASPWAPGGCISTGLSSLGRALGEAIGNQDYSPAEEELGVFSLFDGIGGLRRAFHLLGVKPAVFFAVEVDKDALRVAGSIFPDIVALGDIKSVDAACVRALRLRHPRIRRGLVGGGSPCQGLSGLNAAGRGLADPRSALAYEMERVQDLVVEAWPEVDWRRFAENVVISAADDLAEYNRL